jgi:hypothetical protein
LQQVECQFFTRENLDETYVPIFGAFGLDDGMVARWSANPLGMLWLEVDATLTLVAARSLQRWPVVIVASGQDTERCWYAELIPAS